jgi:hypothetical protein
MSVTTWTRIEPDILTGDPQKDLAHGIAAEISDPLWLLGRQWQFGEWQGEDAGSPVTAQISASSFPIDQLTIGTRTVPFTAASTATDELVEHDGGRADLATRATGGRTFLDALAEHKIPAYQAAAKSTYRFAPADASSVLNKVLIAAAGVDGDRVLAALNSGKIAQALGVSNNDSANFTATVKEWRAWYSPRATATPNPAWQPERLEYQFSMSAAVQEGRVTLNAPEHNGGRIDWDTFSASVFSLGDGTVNTRRPVVTPLKAMPVLLQVPGMPSPWFWEVENPMSDYGRIEAGPSDTARLLLIEAALAYAPNWFLLSLRLPVASLSKLDSLQVADTFGITTIIRATEDVRPDPNWSLWHITQGPGKLRYLLLPPPNISFATSESIEEVAIIRDEAANLAWLLHKTPQTRPETLPMKTGAGDLIYVPMTAMLDSRVPLVLTETGSDRFLIEGHMLGHPAPAPTDLIPAGFRLRDEELPDEGLTLCRRFELGRTPDGSLRLWVSRAAVPGARLPASGLRFDRLDPGDLS